MDLVHERGGVDLRRGGASSRLPSVCAHSTAPPLASSGKARLPEGVTWPQLLAVSAVAGVGFTMSLFISELAFSDHLLVSEAKVGILVASLLAGVCGFVALHRALPREAVEGG